MTGVIDYWCNLFTPEGIRACFTKQGALAGIESVKTNAPGASTEDQT